jgi:hypothetical protein
MIRRTLLALAIVLGTFAAVAGTVSVMTSTAAVAGCVSRC